MRYIDSNVFIYSSFDDGPKGDRSREILRETIKKGDGVTSCLTIDEVVWSSWKRVKDKKKAIEQGSRIFSFSGLRILPIEATDVYYSLSLMRKYPHLRPRDALHLSAAIKSGAETLVSADKDFDDLEEIKREALDS
ncbi:MAG: type II toxin-antitoxin system VapC family toxin [Candidatus Altiarchaeota archaeon]|nr:type II toxin-antitoxin system VapC family toxin [Candidatus Altiarchaeota archaeon]